MVQFWHLSSVQEQWNENGIEILFVSGNAASSKWRIPTRGMKVKIENNE